ncbi:MAG TPA: hypothetical protein VJY63_06670 [Marinospirillum sp.]|uniref:hypothetical protein n=1 Tax=Marinospirillum sp. TaxID=2183934 RepID=UPI002B48D043|nr:hypothetical protein [Marinospirillum sp.]HKM15588.1 hypothetical protein [Marinospirillum sp.]
MIDALLLADLTNDLTPAVRFQRLVYALKEIFNCDAGVLLKKEAEQLRLATLLSRREPVIFAPDNQAPDPYDGLLDALVGEPLPVHDCMGWRSFSLEMESTKSVPVSTEIIFR